MYDTKCMPLHSISLVIFTVLQSFINIIIFLTIYILSTEFHLCSLDLEHIPDTTYHSVIPRWNFQQPINLL